MYDKSLITEKRLAELKAARDRRRSEGFLSASEIIGKSAAEGLEYLYNIYKNTVITSCFLFFTKLHAVFGNLFTTLTMLAGCIGTAL